VRGVNSQLWSSSTLSITTGVGSVWKTVMRAESARHEALRCKARSKSTGIAVPVTSILAERPRLLGQRLPMTRDWVPSHFEFPGYIICEHPQTFGPREELRRELGYRLDERVCMVTVGGSGIGASRPSELEYLFHRPRNGNLGNPSGIRESQNGFVNR